MIPVAQILSTLAPTSSAIAFIVGADEGTVDVVSNGKVLEDVPCVRYGVEGPLTVGMRVLVLGRRDRAVAIAVDWAAFAQHLEEVGDPEPAIEEPEAEAERFFSAWAAGCANDTKR